MPISNDIRLNKTSATTADLLCPRCGSDYLHHSGVTIFDRSEDEKQVTETTVSGSKVTMERTSGAGNPSSRRDGLVVQFWCEGCSKPDAPEIYLRIAQHKGNTEISWSF